MFWDVGSLLCTQNFLATLAVAEAIANFQNLLRIWPSLDLRIVEKFSERLKQEF